MSLARDQLWDSGHDESVEVNQRALIDKVLARYSGEFTVFRELLQNSDDASAKAVEIHLDTEAYLNRQKTEGTLESQNTPGEKLPDLKAAVVHQWTFKNDGIIFRDEDWSRLKKIAEGNPDEEKIGAFGVGFYSLFSVTEEPFVTSGGQWMGFYWKDKKDQLFARRGTIPVESSSEPDRWTTFSMPLREPGPPPIPFDFIRFLASSITFMAHLSEVSVYFDGRRLAGLCKERGVPRPLGLKSNLKRETVRGMMRVTSVSSMPLIIRAEIMQWVYSAGSSTKRRTLPVAARDARKTVASGFFTGLSSFFGGTPQRQPTPAPEASLVQSSIDEDVEEQRKLLQVITTSVVLAVFSADIDVVLDERIKRELLRATKKNTPQRMKYELIYTGKDEYDASRKEDEQYPLATGSVFQGLRADIDGTGAGRVFIGHSTGQTTGIGGHMAARFIPTVERESIDLVDRNVRIWNEELLGVGGYLARTAYEQEMDHIAALWPNADDDSEDIRLHLRSRALHALKFFTFHQSTPSSQVSALMEDAFFSCAAAANTLFASLIGSRPQITLPIMSSAGVRNVTDVRLPNATFTDFLKQLPVLTEDIISGAKTFIESLRQRSMISQITFQDVLQELRVRPLNEAELVACFKWWVELYKSGGDEQMRRTRTAEVLNAAILSLGTSGGADERIIPISSIQCFLNTRSVGSLIPSDGPLPNNLLPIQTSRHFEPQSLQSTFGWREFTIADWVRHILSPEVISGNVEFDVTKSPQWAERVLHILSRAWPSCSKGMQEVVIQLLTNEPCVPTTAGLKTPREAYFQNVHVFPDLPHVALPSGQAVKGPTEKLLQALGVRRHVELQIVFDRMIKTGDWSIVDLAKYLVAVQSTLTKDEFDRLCVTAAFPKENKTTPLDNKEKPARFKAGALYEPLDVFRELGLPVIDWGGKSWRSSSEEAKFLFRLGLRRYPPLETLLTLAGGPDAKIRALALKYFLDNRTTKYEDYQPSAVANIAFVPAIKGKMECLAKPEEVFASPIWAKFGLPVAKLDSEAVIKLGVKDHPPTSMLVVLLQSNPPDNQATASDWFATLATRIADFSPKELKTLAQSPFVPVQSTDQKPQSSTRLLPPSQCYFKRDTNAQIHSKFFTFVDFGSQPNQFLSACGTKHEPTVEEIAQILLDDPHRFWKLAEGRDNYLVELRNIAINRRSVSSSVVMRMKRAAILLGIRRVRKEKHQAKSSTADWEEEEDWDYVYDLLPADKIIVADDTSSFQLFGDTVFTCPQEDLLEDFYMELGSRRLSSMIKEDQKASSELKGSRKAAEIRTLILERLPLFLHEHTHAKPRVPFSWLNNDKNFVVRSFGKLTVTKTLTYGEIRATKSQEASAVAMRLPQGPIELWLAGNDTLDMFEVSTSICKLLFNSPKTSDALLFMTILSTDLRSLRRRGYNVDRILQKQRAERQAAEDLARERAEQNKLLSEPNAQLPSLPLVKPSASTELVAASSNDSNTTLSEAERARLGSGIRNSLGDFGRRFLGKQRLPGNFPDDEHEEDRSASERPSDMRSPLPTNDRASGNLPLLPPPRPNPSRPVTPGSHVTPLSNINSNIDMAIRACREERSSLVQNKERMQVIKESLNDGYCDVSGQGGNMSLAGEMGGIKFYVSKDVPNSQAVFESKHDSLARFIHVLTPLSEIYGLPRRSLHIFYNVSGGLIAFNRNASLFMNLRFFEAWHDTDVRNGRMDTAFISWYFTLAHEVAHNLVQPHNAEHEFYFSSICEARLPALSLLLTQRSQATAGHHDAHAI